jgi:hypothetical protein
MPQPFLGHFLQGVPLTKIALTPLEAASSLAVIHQPTTTSQARPYHRRFPGRPRLIGSAQLPTSPDGYELPFRSTRRSYFPVALDFAWRSRRTGQLHLLRSFDPSVSPFAPIRANPDQRPLPSWTKNRVTPLWGISSQTSESSHPPGLRPHNEAGPCACRRSELEDHATLKFG